MILATSYLTPTQFRALPSDYDLTGYSDTQIQSIVQAASGYADSLMNRTYRAQERTIRYTGAGTSYLELDEKPVLYVKRVQVALPGTQGLILPANQLLIDYEQGAALDYTPLYWQGVLGYVFPRNVPIDVTLAWGMGYAVAKSPAVAIADGTGSGLAAGSYNVAVSTKTFWGETVPSVRSYTTSSGQFVITPTPVLGAYVYRAYASSATNNTTITANASAGATSLTVASIAGMTAGSRWLLGSGTTMEAVTIASATGVTATLSTATVNAHNSGEAFIPLPMLVGESQFVAYGTQTLSIAVNSLSAPANFWQDEMPTTDSSAPPLPDAIVEGVRLLAMARIYEQNSLANRGVYSIDEGDKRIMWRSTAGLSGKGSPVFVEQAREILQPFSLNGLYFG